MKISTKRITTCGLLAALSIALVIFIHFPIFPAADYLEYDPADIPIFIATFALGPVYGFLITTIVSVIQGLTVSAKSGVWGIIMHIMSTGGFVIAAGLYYKRCKTKKNAAIALLLGSFTMTAVMALANIIITPIYTGMPRSFVLGLILPIIVPFNLIKSLINSLITYIIYPYISPYIKKLHS
jgi:riboflavin transporter FmnP